MRASLPRHHAALIAAAVVAVVAVACRGDDRPSAAGDAADGLHPDSFVAPARAVSSAGARLADTAVRRATPDRRTMTTQGTTDVVIAGSPSGFALNDDVAQPHAGSAPLAPATPEPEPPTIIVNEPVAPAPAPVPTPTPPKTTPSPTSPGVMARPGPRAPRGDPRPGTSDTASARPCGAGGAGTSDTASRSPCGQPGTSDTASAHRRVPAMTPVRATVPRRTIPWRRSPFR